MMKAFNNGWNTEPEWKKEREAAVLLQEEEEVPPATAAEAPKEKKEGAEKKEVKKKPYVPTIEDEMKRTEAIIKFGEDSAEFAAKKAEKTYKKSPAYKMMKAFNNGWNTGPEWQK